MTKSVRHAETPQHASKTTERESSSEEPELGPGTLEDTVPELHPYCLISEDEIKATEDPGNELTNISETEEPELSDSRKGPSPDPVPLPGRLPPNPIDLANECTRLLNASPSLACSSLAKSATTTTRVKVPK